jgi:hypothetical protein
MTKLLIHKLKQDLNAESSAASAQGKTVKKHFNIIDEQLGPNLESMTNFFGKISGIDKFDLDTLNPFKKEGFYGQEGHSAGEHKIHKSIDGRIIINPDDTAATTDEYKLYKKLEFQKIHAKSQTSWVALWGIILFILVIIKIYFFISAFFTGSSKPSSSKPNVSSSSDSADVPTVKSIKNPTEVPTVKSIKKPTEVPTGPSE